MLAGVGMRFRGRMLPDGRVVLVPSYAKHMGLAVLRSENAKRSRGKSNTAKKRDLKQSLTSESKNGPQTAEKVRAHANKSLKKFISMCNATSRVSEPFR